MRKKLLGMLVASVLVLNVMTPVYAQEPGNEMFENEQIAEDISESEEAQVINENEAESVTSNPKAVQDENSAEDSNVSEEISDETEAQNIVDEGQQSAQYTARTQAEAIQWVKSQVGKSIDADGAYGAQCVDLILAYYDYLGVPRSSGNGSDYTWNSLPSGWSRIAGAAPQPGDILVYTGGYNNYGHVAIFESTYSTYHQNFNSHSYVERVTYAYNSLSTPYWGVIRPDWSGQSQSTISFGNDDCQWDTTNAFIYTKATASYSGTFTEAGMTVWNAAGNVVASKTEYINTPGSYLEIWYNIKDETGVSLISGQSYTYQFYTVFNGTRYYSAKKSFITNSIPPATVTNVKANAAGKKKVRVSWDKVQGAEGYLVYAQKNGKYAYCGMTSSNTFIDNKALDNTYNFYWVYAYVKNAAGKMTHGGCANYAYAKGIIPAVQNLKAASVTGGVKLTWNKANDADGYLIYGIVAGKEYGYVGMTTTGTTYTDKKASKTMYNYYWVYPYHKDASGKMIVGGTPKYTYGRAK